MFSKLAEEKNRLASISNNPILDTIKSLQDLQNDLAIGEANHNNVITKYLSFLPKIEEAKVNLEVSKNAQNHLQRKLNDQQDLINKVNSYLENFQSEPEVTSNNEVLVKKLVRELDHLTSE